MANPNPPGGPQQIAAMVERADAGDPAARDALFASLYRELHTLAQSHLQRSGGQLTMGATTLLHEAYLDLNRRSGVAFPDRLRFLNYASRAMRGLVIDYIRSRRAQKRGGEITFVSVADEHVGTVALAASVEAARSCARRAGATRSVTRRAGRSEVLLRLVVCRNRGHANVSQRTVERDWAKARVLLHDTLESSPLSGSGG